MKKGFLVNMKNLSRSAMLVSLMMVLSKMLGFLREICLASKFGTSYIVDAYLVCITLPEVLYAILVGGFSESFIAGSARLQTVRQQEKYFNNITTILSLWAVVVAIFSFLGSKWIANILAPGFTVATTHILIDFLRIMSISLPFMVIFNMLCAQMQAKENFIITTFCNLIVTNILILISICCSSSQTPNRLVVGYVSAHVIATVVLWGYANSKSVIKYKPCIDFFDLAFKNLCKLALPLGVSLMVGQLNGVVDRIFSSLLGEGVTSALSYANKVQLLFYTLTTSGFISVCYPRINKHFANADIEGGMYYIRQAVLVALYISVPVMGGLFLFATPIISVLFERGMFTANATSLTSECLTFYALGMPFYALREIGTRALSASLQQKCILKNTILSVTCNLLLNAILFRSMGHIGLALATSLSGMITFLLVLSDMHRMKMQIFVGSQARDLVKIIGSSVVSLFACAMCYQFLSKFSENHLAILPGICVAGITYLGLSLLLHIDVVAWVYQRLPDKMKLIPLLNQHQGSSDER